MPTRLLFGERHRGAAEAATAERLVNLDRPDPPVLRRPLRHPADPQRPDRRPALEQAEDQLAGGGCLAGEEIRTVAGDPALRALAVIAGGDALLDVLLAQAVEPR